MSVREGFSGVMKLYLQRSQPWEKSKGRIFYLKRMVRFCLVFYVPETKLVGAELDEEESDR